MTSAAFMQDSTFRQIQKAAADPEKQAFLAAEKMCAFEAESNSRTRCSPSAAQLDPRMFGPPGTLSESDHRPQHLSDGKNAAS